MRQAENKANSIAGKTYSLALKMRDSGAIQTLQKVYQYGRYIAGKTWRATVKIVDYATAPLRAIKNSLLSVKTLITAIVAGVAAKKLFGDPVAIADAYTSAKIGFSTLLGDSAGQKMMNDLDAFAKATPFNTTQVIQNAQKMLAMGWNAENILTDMKTIGDAAAATGKGEEGLSRIVLALSQIQSKGRLSTEELNQLAEAGISAKRYIAAGLGYGGDEAGLAAMTKDLENGAISATAGLQALIAGMKEYDGMMEKTANETVGGLFSQIQDTFEINILRRWGQGLQDGAKKGLGSIVSMLDMADGALTSFGDTLYGIGKELSNWGATKLNNLVKRFKEISESSDFQKAGLGEKVKMLWSGAIANPFAEWWNGTVVPWWETTAVPWLSDRARSIGAAIGGGLTGGLLALFGVDVVGAAAEGASIAGSFVSGFLDGFDGSAITAAFVQAIANVWTALPAVGKLLVGGLVGGKIVSGVGSVAGGIMNISGLLGAGGLIGSTGNAMIRGTGLLSVLASAGYGLTGGAAGSALGGAAAAGVGAAGIAGGVAALVSTVSGVNDFIASASDSLNEKQKTSRKFSGATKIGGVAAGALIGTAVMPGIGTAIGAGVGGIAGILTGNAMKKHADQTSESMKGLANAEYEATKRAKALAEVDMAAHFGSISLNADELTNAARNLVGVDLLDTFSKTSAAIDTATASLVSFDDAEANLEKNLWMTKTKNGAAMTETEIATLTSSVEAFSTSATQYATDAKYASSAAIQSLVKDEAAAQGILDKSTAYFDDKSTKITELSGQLGTAMTDALSDGVISLDEEASIQKIRGQIADITAQIQKDQYEADLNVIKAKYGGEGLSLDSFKALNEQGVAAAQNASDAIMDAFGQGSIGIQQGSAEWNTLWKGALDNMTEAWDGVGNLGLDTLQTNWSNELGILGQNFSSMLQNNTAGQISAALFATSEETRASIGEWVQQMAPTTEQMTTLANQYKDLGLAVPQAIQDYLNTTAFYEALAQGPEKAREYLMQQSPVVANMDAKVNVDTNSNVEPIPAITAEEAGVADSYTFPTTTFINPRSVVSNKFKGTREEFGVKSSYSLATTLRVAVNTIKTGGWKGWTDNGDDGVFRGGIRGGPSALRGYSAGGMVRGGAQLVKVAEEGTPEMIIPLSSQRRDRGLKLWRKAGEMLGAVGQDSSLRASYAGVSLGSTGHVNLGGVTVHLTVQGGSTGRTADDIRAQKEEIAEAVAEVLVKSVRGVFSNTPRRGGVA